MSLKEIEWKSDTCRNVVTIGSPHRRAGSDEETVLFDFDKFPLDEEDQVEAYCMDVPLDILPEIIRALCAVAPEVPEEAQEWLEI